MRSSCRLFVALLAVAAVIGCGGDDGTSVPLTDSGLDGGSPPDAAIDAGMDSSLPIDAATDGAAPVDAAPDATHDAEPDAEADAGVPPDTAPMHLIETGLYQPGSLSELADGVMPYAPRYELWSDDADKARFLYLPEGETIDTSDIDALVFPVGTKVWKEFSLDGQKLETRLLWKTSTGWVRVAYAWNEAQDDAIATTRGAQDVLGTTHDIPQRTDCRTCHDGAADTLLGVSAIQLAHSNGGVTLAQLATDGWLSDAPPAGIERPDTLEWNALGYLHANCGNCHNPRGSAWDRVDLDLWLRANELDAVTSTQSYLTTVDVAIEQTSGDDTARVEPGLAGDSALITRMQLRDDAEAMPPIASEIPDDAGIDLVAEWIDSL